jgi:PAS domain-containing protein
MSDDVPDDRIRTGKAGFRRLPLLTVALALLLGSSLGSQNANLRPGTNPHETGPNLWRTHRNQVIATSVGFAALASIAVLLLVRSRAQRRAGRLLAKRLQFEQLVSELSASLIDESPDRIDQEVSRALEKVLEAMDIDRCSLFIVLPDQEGIRVTHRAQMPGVPSLEGVNCDKSAIFVDTLRLGKTIALEDVARDLAAQPGERIQALDLGVKSLLLIPVSTSDGLVRCVSFQTTRRHQVWPPDLVSRLRLVGQILYSAVTGKRAEAALRASEERYREVVDTQTDLICRYLPDTTLTLLRPEAGGVDRPPVPRPHPGGCSRGGAPARPVVDRESAGRSRRARSHPIRRLDRLASVGRLCRLRPRRTNHRVPGDRSGRHRP